MPVTSSRELPSLAPASELSLPEAQALEKNVPAVCDRVAEGGPADQIVAVG